MEVKASGAAGAELRKSALASHPKKKRAAFAARSVFIESAGDYSPASLRSASARSVFSHEKAVAVSDFPSWPV